MAFYRARFEPWFARSQPTLVFGCRPRAQGSGNLWLHTGITSNMARLDDWKLTCPSSNFVPNRVVLCNIPFRSNTSMMGIKSQ
jgi:hypothetical protein